MSEDDLRSIMLNACRRQPSFVFSLLEQEERNPDPAPQPAQPDWCTCTYCREMPEGEKVCCQENSERCHSRMPVNIILICLLLFCYNILLLTVLWLHQYWFCHHHVNLLFVCNIPSYVQTCIYHRNKMRYEVNNQQITQEYSGIILSELNTRHITIQPPTGKKPTSHDK